jgi:hypothetical protein
LKSSESSTINEINTGKTDKIFEETKSESLSDISSKPNSSSIYKKTKVAESPPIQSIAISSPYSSSSKPRLISDKSR